MNEVWSKSEDMSDLKNSEKREVIIVEKWNVKSDLKKS